MGGYLEVEKWRSEIRRAKRPGGKLHNSISDRELAEIDAWLKGHDARMARIMAQKRANNQD